LSVTLVPTNADSVVFTIEVSGLTPAEIGQLRAAFQQFMATITSGKVTTAVAQYRGSKTETRQENIGQDVLV